MDIGRRLSEIANFIPHGSTVADIGTDHAMLPVNLIKEGISPRVIASDIHSGPFEAAKQTVVAWGLEQKIDLRLGDGLSVLSPGEVEVAVIAGMGGNTIREVLSASPEVVSALSRLILQPMADAYDLRCWLVQNGWKLSEEKLVLEARHLYVIIAADPGREKITDEVLLEIGPRLVEKRDPCLSLLLNKMCQDLKRILENLSKSQKVDNMQKFERLNQRLSAIKEVYQNVCQKQ